MKSDAATNVQKVCRVLLDADPGDYTLTSDIAAGADMLDKASHVSAIINNLRLREFIESRKGSASGNEQEHTVVEANRSKFVAWVDRDTVKPPSNDPSTKDRANSSSASTHRFERATMPKPMTLAQLASAAERGDVQKPDDAKPSNRDLRAAMSKLIAHLDEAAAMLARIAADWPR